MLPKSKYRHALDDYSEAANEATKRTRSMALLLIFASAIIIISLRNSMQEGYFFDEYYKLHNYWERALSDPIVCPSFGQSNSLDKVLFPDSVLLKSRYKFIYLRNIYTYRAYADYEEVYRSILKEAYLIRIPILGVAFHVNDLCLVSTVSFIMLLFIFSYFLLSEEDALTQLFFKAKQIDDKNSDGHTSKCMPYLRHYYKLHSVRQVLTITPDSVIVKQDDDRTIKIAFLLRIISIFFLMLPAFSCVLFFLYDWHTLERGHGYNTIFFICLSLTITVLIINAFCVYTARKTDKTWYKYHNYVVAARDYEDSASK